jgi:hypothetical protein
MQGDYLDQHVRAAAEAMATGRRFTPSREIAQRDMKRFWARSFQLRDELGRISKEA